MQAKALRAGIVAVLLSGAVQADWALDGAASSLFYVTGKAGAILEVNTFGSLDGAIADDGTATLEIDLASVNTSIEIRDQRMRDIVFEVAEYPSATVALKGLDPALLDGLVPGELHSMVHTASVTVHGTSAEIEAPLSVVKLDADTLMVQPAKPLLVSAASFGLAEAVEELRTIANLPSINPQVVVDFTLVYHKR